MLRFRDSKNPNAGYSYFSKSDAGLAAEDLRKEVGGRGAELLGLAKEPDFEQFKNLLHGLDPHSGDQLTAKLVDGRISYWDITATIPKGVTIAIERGDSRVHDALWEAGRETMADLEKLFTTRARKGGVVDDRVTGNMIWYGFEHPETRPAKEDGMPDMDRHIHFVVPNLTHDPVEDEWKAVKFRPIMDLRKWFDRRFDMRLASKLTDLGYGIETSLKADEKGGKRYYSWDIKGMPQSVVKNFSRRTGEVEKLAVELGVGTAMGKDKLGATSRQFKRKDMTLEDYRAYWDSRVTPDEARAVAGVIKDALEGVNPLPLNTVDKGMQFAIDHHFERCSVMDWHDLAIAAMERCMGGALPEEIEPEAKRQGALFKDGQVTTKAVLAEESRIIDFAREGKGTMRPLGGRPVSPDGPTQARAGDAATKSEVATTTAVSQQKGRPDESKRPLGSEIPSPMPKQSGNPTHARGGYEGGQPGHDSGSMRTRHPYSDTATLSPEQQALVSHVLTSTDQLVLVIGDAGTGKTRSVRSAFDAINCPVEMLAPSAAASRDVLRSEGFSKADTVASFLTSKERQAKISNGVIWVDEAGLLPIRDLSKLTEIAKAQNARIILQGDPKQHRSVVRHGNMMNVLQEYAGLPVGRLTEVWRQRRKDYKAIVTDIAQDKRDKAFDQLADLGWVHQVDSNKPLVDDYVQGLSLGKDVLVIAPTHVEADEVTAAIRKRLQDEGKLATEERLYEQLVPLNWSEAERGDLTRYDGTEVLQFHRNSGTFKAGQKVCIADWKPGDRWASPAHFSVHRKEEIGFTAGDMVRFTLGGHTTDGKHKLNNGSAYRIKGFDKHDNLVLENGWTVSKDFKHLAHGYVTTSHASQGKTVDRVLIAMGRESRGAINAEQFYVSVSRGRESAKVYSDMPAEELKQAIQRTDTRKSATELMKPKPKKKRRALDLMRRMLAKARERFKVLQTGIGGSSKEHEQRKERGRDLER